MAQDSYPPRDSGTSDHGGLSGLGDDDHSQYHNDARHDAHDHSTALGTATAADLPFVAAGNIAAADVQAALEELDTEKSATSHDHDAAYVDEPAGIDTSTGLVAGDGAGGTELVGRDTYVSRGDGATAFVGTNESTTSTSYTDLATVGPEVTLALDDPRDVLVVLSAQLEAGDAAHYAFMSFAVSGATTRAADATETIPLVKQETGWVRASAVTFVSLNAGTNTLTAKYRTTDSGSAASFLQRAITVIPL